MTAISNIHFTGDDLDAMQVKAHNDDDVFVIRVESGLASATFSGTNLEQVRSFQQTLIGMLLLAHSHATLPIYESELEAEAIALFLRDLATEAEENLSITRSRTLTKMREQDEEFDVDAYDTAIREQDAAARMRGDIG